jgi:hypothetical protein
MSSEPLRVGDRVRVLCYGPFRGLEGTIRKVDMIPVTDDTRCFYQVALEGSSLREPVWFEDDEVEIPTVTDVLHLNESRWEAII